MDVLLLALRALLTLLLYAFLGAVLWMLWRDLRRTVSGNEIVRPDARLIVLQAQTAGEEEGETLAEGASFSLQTVTSIGRSPNNTIPLPDAYASAQHALLTWREGHWWLEDQGSRNGTLLNDAAIHGPTVVSAGDVIGVGRVQFKLEIATGD